MDLQEQLRREGVRLIEDLKAGIGLTEEEIQVVEEMVVDSASLAIRTLEGEDVSAEVAIVKATALNIAEAKRARTMSVASDYLERIVHILVTAALAA